MKQAHSIGTNSSFFRTVDPFAAFSNILQSAGYIATLDVDFTPNIGFSLLTPENTAPTYDSQPAKQHRSVLFYAKNTNIESQRERGETHMYSIISSQNPRTIAVRSRNPHSSKSRNIPPKQPIQKPITHSISQLQTQKKKESRHTHQ
jgi:hypothetical protein